VLHSKVTPSTIAGSFNQSASWLTLRGKPGPAVDGWCARLRSDFVPASGWHPEAATTSTHRAAENGHVAPSI